MGLCSDTRHVHAQRIWRQIWFLYEGTPGGSLDAAEDFVIRAGGQKTPLTEPWKEIVPWVVFGARITIWSVSDQPPDE
jgi:hypothetical protein